MTVDYMKLAVEKTIEGMENKSGGPFGAAVVRGDGRSVLVWHHPLANGQLRP